MELQPWQDEVNQSRTASASSKLMRNAKNSGKNEKKVADWVGADGKDTVVETGGRERRA